MNENKEVTIKRIKEKLAKDPNPVYSEIILDYINELEEAAKGFKIEFRIADLDHPMYHPENFATFEKAQVVLDEKYTNRNKGDGYDEYWRNRRTGIERITTKIEAVYDNKNPEKYEDSNEKV